MDIKAYFAQEHTPGENSPVGLLKTQEHGAACTACGLPIFGTALRVRGVRGVHCDMACLETTLFGIDRCRWCGKNLEDKTYTSIESRLCSEGCSDNYWKYVRGDKSAALGTGKRFARWLHEHQPDIYASLVETSSNEKIKLGRPTRNGHTMDAAERKREQRARRRADFRDIPRVDANPPGTQNVTK